ncbi:reverse transcriptase [Phytophthora megakarya]|uniref:Reverse transcriptase n=1 Tax=Phytophthora megakarya TaxID=4795 RepID=A0A225VHW0_9STRA|nr:reverse transcriptase [Phytophthora megakarya]
MVARPQYEPPTKILAGRRERPKAMIVMSASARESITAPGMIKSDREQPPSTELGGTQIEPKEEADDGVDDAVCYHQGGDIFPEDIENNMTVLPEVEATTKEVTIDDIQRHHLLIGAGNALPPAAFGAICDIDVGTAKPVAQRCRRVAPQFREKLSMLIKGLLSAKIITTSTSPWASPIVVIIKANGVDIRLCIDYQVVNSLTRLMVYPMPLINDPLEDLDKALWYCSLDMASGFWGVSMTPRARLVLIVDNALYGHMRIKPDQDRSSPVDVFEEGEPEPEPKPSVLGRRSYVNDILVTGDSWDSMYNRVDKLLDVCYRWNLSISVAKSYWGRAKWRI